jgi:predicted ester cyclase
MSTETYKNAYLRLMEEGFNRGNVAVVDEMLTTDFKEHENLPPGLPPGRDGVKALISALHTAFPDIKHTIEDLTTDRDRVWARVSVRATNTGSLMGQPPTGKRVTYDVIDICRFANGKIVEHWGVSDIWGMMQQLGAVPAPEQPAQARS